MLRSDDASTSRHLAPWIAAAIIVAIVFAAMYPLLGHSYVEWDDPHNLFRNPRFNPPRWNMLGWYWRNAEAGLYVPITYSAWMLIAQIAYQPGGGAETALDPRYFHAANLLVHALCAIVVFALMRALIGRDIPAAIGTIVWAVHPVQVETVAWISGMKDLLGGLFTTLAILLYIKQARLSQSPSDSTSGTAHPRHLRTLLYTGSILMLAMALLSKPIAVMAPMLVAVLDWGILRRRTAVVVAELFPWLILVLPIAILTRFEQISPAAYAQAPLSYRPIVAGDAVAFYLRHVALPIRLGLDHGRAPEEVGSNPWNLAWWLLPLSVALLLWLIRRRARPVVVGLLFFLVALLPVLGFTPFSAQFYSTVWDHYLYVPLIGVALAISWWLSQVRSSAAFVVLGVVVVALAVQSWRQTWHWRDTESLFSRSLALNPKSWLSHDNLTFVALANNDPKRAEYHIRQSMHLRPPDGEIYRNLGIALGQQERFAEAEAALRRAVTMVPHDAASHYLLGEALVQLGRYEEAVEHFEESLRLEPHRTDARQAITRVRARTE